MGTDARRPAVELVVLLASAGGLEALSIVLRDLPGEFPAAVVVQQHLGGHSSVLPAILGRRTSHRVGWALDGQVVAPGQVIVCPPGMHLELMADGSCRLRKMAAPGERRFDVLLASVARSYGARGLGVVLSGSGRDGAEGTMAMKRAGAVVIAQSPGTAKYSSMPIAAAQAGADLVLPIYEIGGVLADIVEGTRRGETDWSPMLLDPMTQWWAEETGRNTTATGGKPVDLTDATAAQRDSLTRPSRSHAANSPAARAEAARLRAAELRRRRKDLAAGFGATEQTVATARLRAEESLRRAQLVYQVASQHAAAIAGCQVLIPGATTSAGN
jgi:two-component system chemotaxis response regulator CheB